MSLNSFLNMLQIEILDWESDVQNLAVKRAWSLHAFNGVFVPLQKLENSRLGA